MRWFGVVSIFVLPSNQFYPPKKTDKQNQPKMIPLQKFFINPLSSHPPGIRRVPFFRCSPWRFASPPASTPQPPGPIGSQGCGGRQSKKPRGWIPSSQGKRSLVSMARWIGKPWHKPIKPPTRVGKMLTSLNVLVFFWVWGTWKEWQNTTCWWLCFDYWADHGQPHFRSQKFWLDLL